MSKRTLPTVRAAEGNGNDRIPTRRTMLTALAGLPVAVGTPIGAEAVAPAVAGASSPAPSALRELHRRWSDIEDELRLLWPQIRERKLSARCADPRDPACNPILVKGARGGGRYRDGNLYAAEEIDAEIDERLADARTRRQVTALERERTRLKGELEEVRAARREREEQLGIAALQRRSGALAGEQYAVLYAMKQEPAASIEDIAALFDVALHELMIVPHGLSTVVSSQFAAEFPWLARLMRNLAALAPGIEFVEVKRSITQGRESEISYARQFAWTCGERPEESGDELAAV